MFENIKGDMDRVIHKDKAKNILHALLINYGFQALVIYRFGYWLDNIRKYNFGWTISAPLYPIYWILSYCVRKAYCIVLDQSADIGASFYINHFGGIEVRNCTIGLYCNIQQQVRIGTAETSKKKLVIGEKVFIGAHSKIYANIKVGKGSAIASGAVVTQDIPNNCLVLGNPARIAFLDYDNSSLL